MPNRSKILLCGVVLLAGWLFGCTPRQHMPGVVSQELHYATGFTIERGDGFTQVNVRNPWDAEKWLKQYVLVPAAADLPPELPAGELIRTPVQSVIAFSSVHCGMIDYLGEADRIVGICEAKYIMIPRLQEKIKAGEIVDIGEVATPNLEMIIELSPDMLVMSPLEGIGYGRVEKIGIPFLEATDYMEVTPLGRAEWIRFYGLFFDCEAKADSLFQEIATRYNGIKSLTDSVAHRPTFLTETKTGGAWYVPGGESYAVNLYRDAGGAYPFPENDKTGSIPMSFENVLEVGIDSDVWIIKYFSPQDMSYRDLQQDFAGYAQFRAFKNRQVYGCNTSHSSYYDDIAIRPDEVLKDFVKIFHPELLPEHELHYFKNLQP